MSQTALEAPLETVRSPGLTPDTDATWSTLQLGTAT